jgi:hypothetical protein
MASDVTRLALVRSVNPAFPGWRMLVILNFSQTVTFRYREHDLLTVLLIFIPWRRRASWMKCKVSFIWRRISCTGTYLKYSSGSLVYPHKQKQSLWPESASELYWPSDRRLSAKWLPTRADRRCHVVSVTDPSGRIFSVFKTGAATFLSSSSVVLTKLSGPRSRPTTFFSGSAGNRTRASGSVAKNSDH